MGIFLAMHYSAQAAPLLVDYIDGETLRRVAAFAGIVLAATIACRVAAILIKWLLNTLVLGWVDHVAGAVGGAALGIILSGTTVYVLSGTNLGSTSHALEVSRLAPEISRASLISADMPWCSSIEGSPADQSCTDLKSLFNQLLGRNLPDQVTEFLGQDLGTLADVVKGTLTGSPRDLSRIVGGQDLAENALEQTEFIEGTLTGSPQEGASLVDGQE